MHHGPAIEAIDLVKRFDDNVAVDGVSFVVPQGTVLGLLGPNGAGKTTTTEVLEGFKKRTAGDVRVLGADPAVAGPAWRTRIGVVLQTCEPERLLTVRECLYMYAGYYPRPLPVSRVLSLAGLTEKASSRCEQLSGGQQRRLDVALALMVCGAILFPLLWLIAHGYGEPEVGVVATSARELIHDGTPYRSAQALAGTTDPHA